MGTGDARNEEGGVTPTIPCPNFYPRRFSSRATPADRAVLRLIVRHVQEGKPNLGKANLGKANLGKANLSARAMTESSKLTA